MSKKSRVFRCGIADKSVTISLRAGGGPQEPPHLYVRCDERDCQYVDLNRSPCPLSPAMFEDGSETRVIEYLDDHAGARICYGCLTEVLGVSHEQVRRASWRLKDESGTSIRPARCQVCHRRGVTIGVQRRSGSSVRPGLAPAVQATGEPVLLPELAAYLRKHATFSFCAHCLARELRSQASVVREAMWALEPHSMFLIRTAQCVSCLLSKPVVRFAEAPGPDDDARRVIELLAQAPGEAHCASCVAFSTDLSLADTRRVLEPLASLAEFERADGVCGTCGRWQSVVRLRVGEHADAERVAAIGDLLSGAFHYRGFRIDVLSFKTPVGWRPLALVKTATGTLVPDMPAIVLGLMSTKIAADELAAVEARAWIDKRSLEPVNGRERQSM